MARTYPVVFRRDAVALVPSSGKTVAQVARELASTARRCTSGSSTTTSTKAKPEGLTSSEWDKLRREVTELRIERELRVKTAALRAKETTR